MLREGALTNVVHVNSPSNSAFDSDTIEGIIEGWPAPSNLKALDCPKQHPLASYIDSDDKYPTDQLKLFKQSLEKLAKTEVKCEPGIGYSTCLSVIQKLVSLIEQKRIVPSDYVVPFITISEDHSFYFPEQQRLNIGPVQSDEEYLVIFKKAFRVGSSNAIKMAGYIARVPSLKIEVLQKWGNDTGVDNIELQYDELVYEYLVPALEELRKGQLVLPESLKKMQVGKIFILMELTRNPPEVEGLIGKNGEKQIIIKVGYRGSTSGDLTTVNEISNALKAFQGF